MAASGGSLRIERWSGKHEHVLVLRGTIDRAGCERLERAVLELCASGTTAIEVDLSRLDLIDHHGIEAVVASKAACANHRVEFRAVPPQAAAGRTSRGNLIADVEREAASR